MKKYEIEDPCQNGFPFPQHVYENTEVCFHGTSSCSAEHIQKNGLSLDGFLAFSDDARFMLRLAEKRERFLPLHTELAQFGVGLESNQERKRIHLTHVFPRALGYASRPGGEMVDSIRSNCESLLSSWEDLSPKERLRLEDISGRVLALTKGAYPVVYAVQVDTRRFDGWAEPILNEFWEQASIDLRCSADIPSERLVARVSYPNGVSVPWSSMASLKFVPFQDALRRG